MRNIPTAIAIVGLLAPTGGQALGIGDIKLHSSLNQPLDAEVPLVLSGEQLGQLRIGLAGPGEFAKAGFERSAALTKLRFDPRSRRDGSLAIRIRSTDAISEPFLSFVLEVAWPEGRMLRGFTLLLDPPNMLAPPIRTASALTATSHAGHLPQSTTHRTPVSDDPAAAETELQRIAPIGGPTEALYGPVGRNEKLWNIAERLNSDPSVTTEQMALALFRFNPRAFSRANVNALNAGTYLRVPDRDYILQTSPSSAHSHFHGHDLARHGRSAKRAALPAVADVTEAIPNSPLGADGVPAKTPQHSATSAIEKLHGENERLRSRVIALEQRLTELTRMLDERVTPRANAQPLQPSPVPTTSSSTTVLAPATVTGEPPPSADGTPASRDTDAASQRVDAESPVSASTRAATTAGAPSAPAGSPSTRVAATIDRFPSEHAQAVGASPPGRSAGVPAADPAPARASTDDAPGAWLWVLGLSAALSTSLIGLWWRRRVPSDHTTAPSHESDDRQASLPLKSVARSAPAGRINPAVTGTAPLAPPAEVATPEAASNDTELQVVDALFEADIYLSYGKYQQAAESIRQAIALTPDRPSHYLKLLEIHAAAKDTEAFETLAETLRSERRIDDPDFWSRMAVLERQMDCMTRPERRPNVSTVGHTRQSGPPADETDQLIAKLKQFSVETQSRAVDSLRETSERTGEPDEGQQPSIPIEHSVPAVAQPLTRAPEPPPAPAEQIEPPSALANDQNVIAYEPPLPTSARVRRTESGASELPTEAERSIENLLKELSAIHFEEHLNSNLDDPGASQPLGGRVAKNPEAFAAATQRATADDDDCSEPETSDQDSLEAKLDLARAYADMADYTQARSVLTEVITDGTPQQRSEAQALLSRLR